MTLEIDAFRAHVGSGRLFRKPDHLVRTALKFSRQHVIGVVAEAIVAQRDVWGFLQDLLSVPTECFHPDVPDARSLQGFCQRLAIELWKAPRHREGSNVHQSSDPVRAKCVDHLFERTGGVSDGVESRQVAFNAGSRDALQSISDETILIWKNRPQVQQYFAFFYSCDDRRIGRAQALG